MGKSWDYGNICRMCLRPSRRVGGVLGGSGRAQEEVGGPQPAGHRRRLPSQGGIFLISPFTRRQQGAVDKLLPGSWEPALSVGGYRGLSVKVNNSP